jgi:multidrug transporter EmrE-like cation transporter
MQTIIGSIAMVCSTVLANIFMKIGAGQEQARWLLGVAGTYTLLGVLFFGVALALYASILRTIPLSIAQSLTAAQFAGVIAASAFVLAEPVPMIRWLGVGLILVGILVVGYSA